jgi:hypothetical protein
MAHPETAAMQGRLSELRRFIRPVVDAPDVSLYEIVSWPPDQPPPPTS